MGILLIGTSDEIDHGFDGIIGDDLNRKSYWSCEPLGRPSCPEDYIIRRQFNLATSQKFFELRFVYFMVSPYQGRNNFPIRLEEEGFHQILRPHL